MLLRVSAPAASQSLAGTAERISSSAAAASSAVFTREWLETDVAIVDGAIAGLGDYDGDETIDASGRFVVPGFIDAHMHLESVKLTVDEFARLVLPLGTTAVVADPHEIANVLGTDGVHWLLDASSGLALDVFFMAPSCVPASPFESPRRPLEPGDLEALMRRRRVIGLAEMMNFPGVVAGSPSELEKLSLEGSGHVDGHAPGLLGKELQAYASTRIGSDHEALTAEEGRERIRAGMWLLIREASMARNLRALVPLVRELGSSGWRSARTTAIPRTSPTTAISTAWCERPWRRRRAGGRRPDGIPARRAVPRCTIAGAIAPGYLADLLVLPDLECFVPRTVLKGGRPVGEIPRRQVPDWVRQTVRIAPVAAELPDPMAGAPCAQSALFRTRSSRVPRRRPSVVDGAAVGDPSQDLAKIAVVERHLATGRIGLGFVSGSGLLRGALASTVAHDAHNLVASG